jgi:transcriptional regulator with XRE-family HTH domain
MEADAIDPKKELGQRLKQARLAADLTQEAVGQLLDISKVTVSSWEIGKNVPDALTIRRLSKIYNVSTDTLLRKSSASPKARMLAEQYDQLAPSEQQAFDALWAVYLQQFGQKKAS